MSKRTNNNRFVTSNKPIEQNSKCRKCVHHIYSHHYAANMRQHDEIIEKNADKVNIVDIDSTVNIKIVFHFLAPKGSYNKDRVLARVHDIILSLNDDFNNYTTNQNTMNNFKYKSIINQVFISNNIKQNIYLGPNYIKYLPTKPSNITFELGEIYYYPVRNRLNLSQYDDVKEVEIEYQVIKQFIHQNRADAINPENFLNIWVIDMTDTAILGFSNFPWEIIDNYHGVVINRKAFFPEDYGESNFALFKTFTHEVGHYFGLLHVFSHNSGLGVYAAVNLNADSEKTIDTGGDFIVDTPNQLNATYDPTDKIANKRLHSDNDYNPLFMNFMDYTYDKYVAIFTQNQIQKMRYMLLTYRPNINSVINKAKLPIPKYNPDTDTITGTVTKRNSSARNPPLIPSHESTPNPRLAAQGFMAQQPQIPQDAAQTYQMGQQILQNMAQQQNAPRDMRVNTNLSQLIPNLSAGNVAAPTGGSREQLIANIQSNLPPDPNNIKQQTDTYENMIKKYKDYNSTNGYAMNYPFDPYLSQQNNNQFALYKQLQDQNAKTQSNDQDVPRKEAMPYHPVDPRMMPQFMDPRYMMQMDPKLSDNKIPFMMPPGMPIDPRFLYYKPPKKSRKTKKSESKKSKKSSTRNLSDSETEINLEAVQNIRNPRAYTKYAQAKPDSKKNSLDPNYKKQPSNLKEITKQKIQNRAPEFVNDNMIPIAQFQPPHMSMPPMPNMPTMANSNGEMEISVNNYLTPSDLVQKVSHVDEQLKNIRENMPKVVEAQQKQTNTSNNIAQTVAKASMNDNKQKFNKFGQITKPVIASSKVIKNDITRAPRNRFVRTKPLIAN
ncbi:putative bifunctional metalloprotease/ubiquitin-protein ligase [Tupanvirus soda lake]|uniref:Bifunctional metalloprotease/ubiquitin-protein ligase n=2 Tax=Tupanvirus TaxID=2094720 RepID=A0AC62ADU9_9VIRU|nr:putative bifunctional metalloprotease/ubiquitin-protein ligase [Tupanvirus soda lake]QKU35939.1 putative bifunctional metalloprotease/ubiquitin-protein ligase [Tupanvirus soda lake]